MNRNRVAALAGVALFNISSAAAAQDHGHHSAPPVPKESIPPTPAEPAADSEMDHAGPKHAGTTEEHSEHEMPGALGGYPIGREASGTAWQPDTSGHMGLMKHTGTWMLMGHGVLNLVYDHQSDRRGDDKAFASGMLMGTWRVGRSGAARCN